MKYKCINCNHEQEPEGFCEECGDNVELSESPVIEEVKEEPVEEVKEEIVEEVKEVEESLPEEPVEEVKEEKPKKKFKRKKRK